MNRGNVALRKRAWRMPAALVLSFAFCSQAMAQPHVVGRWDEPPPVDGNYAWPSGAMHCILLATGKVLYWYSPGCGSAVEWAFIWDPVTGTQTRVSNVGITDIRDCNAQSQLASGDLPVAGGGCGPNDEDAEEARVFRLAGCPNPWLQVPSMARERWYATCTTLQDGRILITSGAEAFIEPNGPYVSVEYPKVYDPTLPMPWQSLISAVKPNMPLYPFMFLLPGGGVFFAGPAGTQQPWPPAAILDTATWTWSDVGSGEIDFWGAYGSAVMYLPGKVLKAGGAGPCDMVSGSAAIIDTTQPSPIWVQIDPLIHARKDLNLVIGATGLVYAIGGQVGPCVPGSQCSICVPVKWAESIDLNAFPLQWIELAQATIHRGYHSSALLLPSGKILSCGGESVPPGPGQPPPSISAEIFSPPYLFRPVAGQPGQSELAPRPPIGYAPTEVVYDTQFAVTIAQPLPYVISEVNLIRLGAVTHGFDMDQRYVPLEFFQNGFHVEITAPEDGSIAPPGHYMLFLVSADGVPSEAAILKVKHPPLP